MTTLHLAIVLTAAVILALTPAYASPLRSGKSRREDAVPTRTADQAVALLKEGNRRFSEGKARHHRSTMAHRESLIEGQSPFAVIIGCADSRVPVELIFDTGFGELFVCRNAGNVIASDIVGSVAFAVDHLHTPLIVVMGHEGCGAVTAAFASEEERAAEAYELQGVLRMIDPAIEHLRGGEPTKRQLDAAIEANVRHAVSELMRLRDLTGDPEVMGTKVVGAVYELVSGRVRFLDDPSSG